MKFSRACVLAVCFLGVAPGVALGQPAHDPWLLIWGGGKDEHQAERAKQLLEAFEPVLRAHGLAPPRGFPLLLHSSEHRGLKPGFHIVAVGLCGEKQAKAYRDRLRRFYKGVYVRKLPGSSLAPGCPVPQGASGENRKARPADRAGLARLARAVYAEVIDSPRLQSLFGDDLKCMAAWGTDCAIAERQNAAALASGPSAACRSLIGMAVAKGELKARSNNDDAWTVAVCVDREEKRLAALARRGRGRWRLIDLFAGQSAAVAKAPSAVGEISLDAFTAKGQVVCLERGNLTAMTMYGHTSHLNRLYCYWAPKGREVLQGLPHSPVVFELNVRLENEYDNMPDWKKPKEIIGDDGVVEKSESMKARYWLRDVGPDGFVLCLAESVDVPDVAVQAMMTAFGIKAGRMRRVEEGRCE